MSNPLDCVSVFLVTIDDASKLSTEAVEQAGRMVLSCIYSRSGVVSCYRNYADKPSAKAGGYGYDKTGSALADALSAEYGIARFNGAAGVDAVITHALACGVRVTTLSDALYSIGKAGK